MMALSATAANSPPVITSNGGGVSASVFVAENTTAVTTVTATDPDAGQSLTYSISGGADAAKFAINSATGALTFSPAPNFEAPTDADTNNVYVVIVQVSDGNGGTDTQTLNVTVTNVNEPPFITSNGGGGTADVSVAENTTTVTTVVATDPEGAARTYSISGGADAARFAINPSTGALTFIIAPNFEAPTDGDSNNVYVVIVRAADPANNGNQQTLSVTVLDIGDSLTIQQVGTDTYELSMGDTTSGTSHALESTTNFAIPASWQAIFTNQAGPGGWLYFTNVTVSPLMFYRTRSIP